MYDRVGKISFNVDPVKSKYKNVIINMYYFLVSECVTKITAQAKVHKSHECGHVP